ncbi:GNAT family N-acetyltransferase [Janthinobacterium sp. PC23-8]|uniref:GNAT family N-acetyltransferase n=1 Tax=Janthinobacterium sp. PC23-8 TaxID=2012679 RepID=UPI000B96A1A7|nr:GNAT family N-acetyltransferase [Janthinobacterium sp. PC23-8]OYO27455.1 hypothetical protein CD932_19940 [Janthinobacterium sp. PC23-8]
MAAQASTGQAAAQPQARRFSSLAPGRPPAIHASAALAHAWAGAIVCYWQAGLASGAVDAARPLYLLDLAPGRGQLAWLLLGALQRRLAEAGLELRPCLAACGDDDEAAASLLQHGYLQHLASEGCFDTARFDSAGATLSLRHQGMALRHAGNPLVILAPGCFETLPSELYWLHQGQPREARVSFGHEAQAARPLEYQWQVCDEAALPDGAAPLLRHYLARASGACVLLPLAACALLDALARFGNCGSLLLAADHGCDSEQQIRLGGLHPPSCWPADGGQAPALPLNVHALRLHQQARGAWTWSRQLEHGGLIVHAAGDAPPHAAGAIIAALAAAHPDEQPALQDAARGAGHNASSLLALLRLSHHDPLVLQAGLQAMLDAPPVLSDLARRDWRQALAATWHNYLPLDGDEPFYRDAGLLAAHLGHWGLAKACLRLGLDWHGDDAGELYLLACCEAASGGADVAAGLLARASALAPELPHVTGLAADIGARLQRRLASACFHEHEPDAAGLRLEPLGEEHAASLLYQYRDEQIAVLTRLPDLDTLEQVQAWIRDEQQIPSLNSYAVMHDCWGFAGCVSLHCAGTDGYFHFWTGTDFQDAGVGQGAAALLFDMAVRRGVRRLFTSAYLDNQRSLHALGRLGFTRLPARALAPDDTLLFLQRPCADGQQQGDEEACAGLYSLCAAIGSPFQFIHNEGVKHVIE